MCVTDVLLLDVAVTFSHVEEAIDIVDVLV